MNLAALPAVLVTARHIHIVAQVILNPDASLLRPHCITEHARSSTIRSVAPQGETATLIPARLTGSLITGLRNAIADHRIGDGLDTISTVALLPVAWGTALSRAPNADTLVPWRHGSDRCHSGIPGRRCLPGIPAARWGTTKTPGWCRNRPVRPRLVRDELIMLR